VNSLGLSWPQTWARPHKTEIESPEALRRKFREKYWAKTGSGWEHRFHLEPKPGSCELVLVGYNAGVLLIDVSSEGSATQMTCHLPCTLDETGKFLSELIFSGEITTNALRSFDIDTAKMTLGALTERQVLRGFKVLNDI
jgi:hypothetical protein